MHGNIGFCFRRDIAPKRGNLRVDLAPPTEGLQPLFHRHLQFAAWNVVTSLNDSEAANFGRDGHLQHAFVRPAAGQDLQWLVRTAQAVDPAHPVDITSIFMIEKQDKSWLPHDRAWFNPRQWGGARAAEPSAPATRS